MQEKEIFRTGRHKELNFEKFIQIIDDIDDFGEYAKHNETAMARLQQILIHAKVNLKIAEKEKQFQPSR